MEGRLGLGIESIYRFLDLCSGGGMDNQDVPSWSIYKLLEGSQLRQPDFGSGVKKHVMFHRYFILHVRICS